MNSKQKFRARIAYACVVCVALVLAASLYWIQIENGSSYAAKADRQYVKPTASSFDRGTIYFQSKDGTRIAAAGMGSGFILTMNPTQVASSSAQDYAALSQYVKIDQPSFLANAAKPNDRYEVIDERMDSGTAQSIRALKLPGITVSPQSWRSYPGASLASHELGLIGENAQGAVEGRYGLERFYQPVLFRTGSGSSVNVFAQLFSGVKDSVFGGAGGEGDIVTTIEPTVQKYLEQKLSETENQWHSDEVGGVIIDPSTGAIVAMGSWPTFDPNDTSKVKNAAVFSNPLVEHVYEMGSIVKPLTMATALDSGAVMPESTYDDTGTMTLNGRKISNYDGKARGVIPMQQILSQSLNVGAATIALKTGKAQFSKYFESFGLGDKTGIDEPNEATGIIGNLSTGRDIETATASYGQGIAMSPINTARALSILANGGYVVTPHLVSEIDYADGTVKKIDAPKTGPVISRQTADEVTAMLVNVVDKALANGAIRMDNYEVAAKTGTAQIADHVHGGYYPDRYLHSFFGYFPASHPKYLVFLYQIWPKGAEYASATLTTPFSDIVKFLINYYDIPPDR